MENVRQKYSDQQEDDAHINRKPYEPEISADDLSSIDSDFDDLTSASGEDSESGDLNSSNDECDEGQERKISTPHDSRLSFTTTLSEKSGSLYRLNENSNNSQHGKIILMEMNEHANPTSLNHTTDKKKKLFVGDSLLKVNDVKHSEEILALKERSNSTSLLKTIGRFFFRGSTSNISVAEKEHVPHNVIPGTKITFKDGERDEHWDFEDGSFQKKECQISTISKTGSTKRVLKLIPSTNGDAVCKPKEENYSNSSKESMSSGSIHAEIPDPQQQTCATWNPLTDVIFTLCDSAKIQCSEWRRQFKNCKGVEVKQQSIFECKVDCDAVVIPGNSFGFLDGEPEIQFSIKFGWTLQEDILQIIREQHDGELLVGQAIITRMKKSSEGALKNGLACPKYAIYVPVMRVPLHTKDTVNAYLAFRAALREVKLHNKRHEQSDEVISTVLCPPLCDGFGCMPAGRIAVQMKMAFDAVASGKRNDLTKPSGLGPMATNHVEMTTRLGNWC